MLRVGISFIKIYFCYVSMTFYHIKLWLFFFSKNGLFQRDSFLFLIIFAFSLCKLPYCIQYIPVLCTCHPNLMFLHSFMYKLGAKPLLFLNFGGHCTTFYGKTQGWKSTNLDREKQKEKGRRGRGVINKMVTKKLPYFIFVKLILTHTYIYIYMCVCVRAHYKA